MTRRLTGGLVALTLLLLSGCSDGSEEESTPTPTAGGAASLPGPRTEVAGATWDAKIAAVGGLTEEGAATARVDLYDPESNRWSDGPALPQPLHHVGVARLGGRLYVAGGYAGALGQEWQPQARVYSLGAGEARWREEPSLGRPRGALALAATDDRLVAVGGMPEPSLRTTETFVPGAVAWQPGPDLGQGREHLAAASVDGRVFAIAGRVGGLESNLSSVESWDPTSGSGWRSEPSLNDPRGGTAAASDGRRICVAGGEATSGTIASVECQVSGVSGGWVRAAQLETPRHGLTVVFLGDHLHVIGGGPTPGLSVSGAHEVLRP